MMLDIKVLLFMNKNSIKKYKATIDLNSAIYLLEAFNNDKIDIDIEKIYFELQQSAEKLLKSILSRDGIKFPRSHDIERIIELCEENSITLVDDIEFLIELNDYAVDGRYSIIHDDINEADRYIVILERLIELIENKRKK